MTRTTTKPNWAPVFHGMINRLTHPPTSLLELLRSAPPEELWIDDITDDATDGDTSDANYGSNTPAQPAERLSVLHALAALQLARICHPLGKLHAPGAITMIDTGPRILVDPLVEVLGKAVLPSGVRAIIARETSDNQPGLLIVKPSGDGASAQRGFLEALHAAIFTRQPCLILRPEGTILPADLAKLLPPPLTPLPMDRAALQELLRVMFTGVRPTQVTKSIARLPKGAALGSLTPEAIALALRASNPSGVVAAIKAHLDTARASTTTGLTIPLDHFDPDQPAVKAARQATHDLVAWRAGKLAWSDIPNGLIFFGPPGTGKTQLARAMATEAGLPIVETSAAAWQKGANLSLMLERMQASFSEAQRAAPCVLFIDEIDTMGTREERNHNSSYHDQVMAAFLVGITQLRETAGVILAGATNRLSGLDAAVLRPGRFDLKLPLGMPTRAAIAVMLAGRLSGDSICADARARLATRAIGLSPAQIDGALRQARAECRAVGQPLSEEAIAAAFDNGPGTLPALAWRIALHEAGHAAIAIRLGMSVTRITAGPKSGWVEWMAPATEGLTTDFAARIAVHMAGRAAEEELLGTPSAGAGGSDSSDLANATQLAMEIELRSGLGSSGLLWSDAKAHLLHAHPALRDRVEAHLQNGLRMARDMIRRMPLLVEGLAQVAQREGELSGPALAEWAETIRSFDPDIQQTPPGGIVIFSGRTAKGSEPDDPPGPQTLG